MFSEKLTDMLSPSPSAPALDGLKRTDPPGTLISKVSALDTFVG